MHFAYQHSQKVSLSLSVELLQSAPLVEPHSYIHFRHTRAVALHRCSSARVHAFNLSGHSSAIACSACCIHRSSISPLFFSLLSSFSFSLSDTAMSASKSKSATTSQHGADGSGDHKSTPSKSQHSSTTSSSAQHNTSEPAHAKELHSSNNSTPSPAASKGKGASTVGGSSNSKLGKTGNNAGLSGKSGKDEDDEAKMGSGDSSTTAASSGGGGGHSVQSKAPHQSTDPHVSSSPPTYGASSSSNKQSTSSTAAAASKPSSSRALGSGGAAFGKDEKMASGDRMKREAMVPGSKEAKGSLGGVGAHAASAGTTKQYNTPQVKSKL